MKQFIQLSQIKMQNEYTFLNNGVPTISDKSPLYTNGDTWLDFVTGYSYLLTDDVAGTWVRTEQANDTKMLMKKDKLFMTVINYLNNIFAVERNKKYLNNNDIYYDDFPYGMPTAFTRKEMFKLLVYESIYSEFIFDDDGSGGYTITVSDLTNIFGSIEDSFAVGDTIYIQGSRRNDGYYTISALDITLQRIIVQEEVINETSNAFIYLCVVPEGILDIIAEMVYYDIIKKPKMSGIRSESIGTYSYTKETSGNSLNYPDDILSGLESYRMLSIGGQSLLVL